MNTFDEPLRKKYLCPAAPIAFYQKIMKWKIDSPIGVDTKLECTIHCQFTWKK